MRRYLIGALVGASLSLCASVYADITAPHFTAQEQADIDKCFASVKDGKTQVSFDLTEDGVDYASAVCWPEGIK